MIFNIDPIISNWVFLFSIELPHDYFKSNLNLQICKGEFFVERYLFLPPFDLSLWEVHCAKLPNSHSHSHYMNCDCTLHLELVTWGGVNWAKAR